jgi:hypothetical protein
MINTDRVSGGGVYTMSIRAVVVDLGGVLLEIFEGGKSVRSGAIYRVGTT